MDTLSERRSWAALVAALVALGLLAAMWVAAPAADAATIVGPVRHSSGRCLENAGGSAAANNPARLAICGTGVPQQWSRFSDGSIRVQGRCLDLRDGATANNTAVVLNPCSATAASQMWSLYYGSWVVSNKASLCLQPQNGSTTPGTATVITSCANAAVQRWTLPAVSTPPTTTTPSPTTTTRTTTATPPPTTTTRTTTTTRPPTTTTTPPSGSLSWDSDFTRSGLSHYQSTPWNQVGAPAPTLVNSPSTSGARSLQFTMPGGGTRSEVEPATSTFKEGDDRWFGFSVYLPAGFPTQVTSWQLLTQWKNDGTGSPPLEVTVGKGNLWISGGYGHPTGPKSFAVPISAADTGRRIDLVFHIVFSRNPATASVNVWRDGTQRITDYHPTGGTLYPNSGSSNPTGSLIDYWKMGLYRDPAITQPATCVLERARVGTGYGAVSG